MDTTRIRLDDSQQELVPFYSLDFRHRCVYNRLVSEHSFPWHWHAALEFVHILKGTAVFNLPQQDVVIPEDGIIIINSEIFHGVGTRDPRCPAECHTHMTTPDLLSGGVGNAIKAQYFDPVIRQSIDLPYYLILPNSPQHARAKELFEGAYQVATERDLYSEFYIRQYLSELWMIFVRETEAIWQNATPKNDVRGERVKQMLTYIRENCTDKLTLEDIAACAGISTRECLRCFQSMLKMSPFEYLIDCRVRRAADMLQNSSESITTIALSCGFSSASYFCRTFKKIVGSSPTEYKLRQSTRK